MANSAKVLARGTFTASEADLYTVPNATTSTIVTSIVICNQDAADQNFTLLIDGVEILDAAEITAGATVAFELKQVIPADATPQKIRGLASVGSQVTYHISGMEIA